MRIYRGDLIEYFDFMRESCVHRHVLVHGCNCAGVFNSGVAKLIRQKYPKVYQDYLSYVKINGATNILGKLAVTDFENNCKIVSAFTQQYYGRDPNVVYVSYKALEVVLEKISLLYPDAMIILPKIGAGLANGDWNIIKEIIQDKLRNNSYMVFEI